MKIIHTADLHLDSKIDSLPSDKRRIRREEVIRSFERMADYATNNGVKAVIIAGDMFDTSRVSLKTKARVLQAISSNSTVDFLYLSGNHDDENFISDTNEIPSNLKIFSDKWDCVEYENVCIYGRKIVGADMKMVYDTFFANPEKINIVAMHGQVVGYKSAEVVETISIPSLKEKNIDYLALGHIHGYSEGVIDNRGVYVYSGCLEGRGFDELGEKGFVLINVEDNKLTYERVDFSCRNFYEYSFDVSGKSNWYETRAQLIAEATSRFSKDSLLKVILTGERGTDFDIDIVNLVSMLNENFFFAKVYDRTIIKVDISQYETDKSVRGEFVKAVWDSNLSEEMKGKVIMCGLNALKGEDI